MSGVLFATHGNPGADAAARIASQLAERLTVPLAVVVVYEPVPVADFGFGAVSGPTPEDDEVIRGALLTRVREQLARCALTSMTPQVCTGFIVSEIGAVACTMNADVIVTGLGPHDLMDRALGGETALRLAQNGTTPVLAVPSGAPTVPRRVVAAIDFSPTSCRAAALAARWLRQGDELHLVYVADRRSRPPAVALTAATSPLVAQLATVGTGLRAVPGVRIESTELRGNPARALLAYAQRVDADLITLGSHGYGALKRLALGSVASKVIRLATTAVLVAPTAPAH